MTDGNTDSATILHPDLSTSTKTVVDMDGGDADPGDALRYTITLKESANVAASNLAVVDTISGSLGNFVLNTGQTTCNGTDTSTASQLQRTGISLPAGGTCKIVFDVTISAVAGTGLEITNTATITNPAGAGATPSAAPVVVSASQQPASGNKYLYVYANQTMLHKLDPAGVTAWAGCRAPRDGRRTARPSTPRGGCFASSSRSSVG